MTAVDWFPAVVTLALAVYAVLLLGYAKTLYAEGSIRAEQSFDPTSGPGRVSSVVGLSIVVPFRNEALRLPELEKCLSGMRIPAHMPVEVLYVDDGSTDGYITRVVDGTVPFRTLSLPTGVKGKKAAIDLGVNRARFPWVLSLDADARPGPELVERLSGMDTGTNHLFVFVIAPVRRSGFAACFFDLEFLALQAVGLATALSGKAILANGAALLFRREAYLAVAPERKDWSLTSGDDVFLLSAVKRRFGPSTIAAVPKGIVSFVEVGFPSGVSALFRQRLRWISKNHAVPDRRYHWTAIGALLANILWMAGVAWALWAEASGWLWAMIALKTLPEALLLVAMAKRTRRPDCLPLIPLCQIIYPIYLCILVAFGFFSRPLPTDEPA